MSEDQLNETTETTEEENNMPEYIPEKFWNKDLNEVNVEEMGASYKALEKKIRSKNRRISWYY